MADKNLILAVDDEADILNLLEFNLKKASHNVITAMDGEEALLLAAKKTPDLILLDVMLPNMDGMDVLKALKKDSSTENIPVIMLTAKGEEVDRILGFELGADDYITKPFSPREMLLRVKAVLKRTEGAGEDLSEKKEIKYKDLRLDLSKHKVYLKKKEIELTTTEFKMLKFILTSKGNVLSRDTILDKAWGDDSFVTPRTVDTHMRRLREKLKSAGNYIETVRGVGYRLKD